MAKWNCIRMAKGKGWGDGVFCQLSNCFLLSSVFSVFDTLGTTRISQKNSMYFEGRDAQHIEA